MKIKLKYSKLYIPSTIISVPGINITDIETRIIADYQSITDFSKEQVMVNYLHQTQKLKWYGSYIYNVQLQTSDLMMPQEFLLAVNVEGLSFIDQRTKDNFQSFSYTEIDNWSYAARTLTVTMFHGGKIVNTILKTMQGIEICSLLEEYSYIIQRECEYARALVNYNIADDPNLLQFKAQDIIQIIEKSPKGWWTGELNGTIGLFPVDRVQLLMYKPEKEISHDLHKRRTVNM